MTPMKKGWTTERMAVVVVIAGLALCIAAWVQPQAAKALPKVTTPPQPSSTPGEISTAVPDEISPVQPSDDAMAFGAQGLPAGEYNDAMVFVENSNQLVNPVNGDEILLSGKRMLLNRADQITRSEFAADYNHDGELNDDDLSAYAEAFDMADPQTDLNGDGIVDGDDFAMFADHYDSGARIAKTVLTTVGLKELPLSLHFTNGERTEVKLSIMRYADQKAIINVNGSTIVFEPGDVQANE